MTTKAEDQNKVTAVVKSLPSFFYNVFITATHTLVPLRQRLLLGFSDGECVGGDSPFTGLQCGALILRYVV